MEIQKIYLRSFNLKRFTLSSIAAAILLLNAETANAISCPSTISDNSLAGIICDFDTGSTLTVENGGVVGGINMTTQTPLPPSHITINSGGTVSNSTGIGIAINNSALSNGLINNGTISNTSGMGIDISNSSLIDGGLINNGLISSGSVVINISASIINGGILNSGTINSTQGTGIIISNSSTINGGILNSGSISVGGIDSGISILSQTTINDGITNTGSIQTDGGNGIIIRSNHSINGGISNSGTISSTVNSGIDILNVSEVIGDITNTGTISGGNNGLGVHNASTVTQDISNSGDIHGENGKGISIFSSTMIGGSISNTGTISGGTTGIAVSSTSSINGAIANSGIIRGDIFAININGNSSVSQIEIIGQNARLIGAVEAAGTDLNITSGAIFTSEGTFDVNTFNINSNAVFNMANNITANNVLNTGTLAIQNTQTINGNYTQNTGGTLQIGITNTSDYGHLSVTGSADLLQSGQIAVQVANNAVIHQGDIFNILEGNTFMAPADGYQVTDNSFFWDFMGSNANNTGVNLTAMINDEVYSVCSGSYCQGAADVVIGQINAGNPAFLPFASITNASEFTEAVSQVTPELPNENFQVALLMTRAALDAIPMWGRLGRGTSAGDAMIYQPGKLWIKPYGGSMTQNENNSVPGFNAKVYGIVFGADTQLNEDWLFGGALAFGKNSMQGKSELDNQTLHGNDFQGILYAAKTFPYHLFFAGQGTVGYGDNHSQRNIPLYASTARGSYNSWFTNLRAELGWSRYVFNQNLILTPEMDVSYLFLNQGHYQESGSTMDLSIDSSHNASLIFGAYGHASYQLANFKNQQNLMLTGYVGVARNVLNSEPETTATFVAGGPSFSTFGTEDKSFVFRGGVGLALLNPTKPLNVNLNYDLQSGNHAYSGVGTLTVSYKT